MPSLFSILQQVFKLIWLKQLAFRLLLLGVLLIGGLGFAGGSYLIYLNTDLPYIDELADPDYSLPSIIYDRHGVVVDKLFVKRRKLVTYEQLPSHLVQGLIAKEDLRFFEHFGIDPLRMLKAAWVNALSLYTAQGASTLTQQTARQFFLTLEKTWERKLKEILLALQIERRFSKEEILTLYLNKVNFGDAWGVSAAAEFYFGKPVEQLSLAEASTLVGLLPAPNRYKPTRNPHLSREQRNIVLRRMYEEGFITRIQQMAAASEPVVLRNKEDTTESAVAYYVELVRRQLVKVMGSKLLYEGGLHVYTAMDLSHQMAAHQSLLAGVHNIDYRQGYRGSSEKIELEESGYPSENWLLSLGANTVFKPGKIAQAVVIEIDEEGTQAKIMLSKHKIGELNWATVKKRWRVGVRIDENTETRSFFNPKSLHHLIGKGDLIQVEIESMSAEDGSFGLQLYQEPYTNGALYAANPNTGEVLAMVGGTRFGKERGASEFIRATQAKRQPGSAFKPIVYAAALDEGYTPASVLEDSPRTFILPTGKKHTPDNYDKRFLGRMSFREALVRSRNIPTVQLVDEIGAKKVISYSHNLGLTTYIPEESLIALGTHSVKLSELTRAYGVFPAQGILAEPIYILRIETKSGSLIYQHNLTKEQVVSPSTAYLVTDILQDVVRRPYGTGFRVMKNFGRPMGGKTGTTQNYTDAWFLGFIPQLVTGVYVGNDDPNIPLGNYETGSRSAAPIWRNFMDRVKNVYAVQVFKRPPSVVSHRVDKAGRLLSMCDSIANSYFELFKSINIPSGLQDNNCSASPLLNPYKQQKAPGNSGKPQRSSSSNRNLDL